MIYKVTCPILLLASAALAQDLLLPGTLPGALASTSSSPASSSSDARQPITPQQRIRWAVRRTMSPGVLFSAGLGTLFDVPKAYGTHWSGFGERYAVRLSTLAVSNTMEAGLGAAWGEDPRYTRDPGAPFKDRIGHALKMTFMAENRNGDLMPAYARLIAMPGSNFLSNNWRAESDATVLHAVGRTGFRFLGRFGNNAFDEFWPDVRHKLHLPGARAMRPSTP